MDSKTILVTEGTGRQGGTVVRHSLKRGFTVHAITCNSRCGHPPLAKGEGGDLSKPGLGSQSFLVKPGGSAD